MRVLTLIIVCGIFDSCHMSNNKSLNINKQEITLAGKIAVTPRGENTCFIFDNSDSSTAQFKVRNDKQREYSGFAWVNGRDSFVGVEYIKNAQTAINQGNIVCFDLSGNIISSIYESQNGEIAGGPYLSRKDRRLLFETQIKGDFKVNPFEGLSRELSIVIMDFNKKEIIKRIEKIGLSPNFEIYESPWLFDEDRFLYSISGDAKIITNGVRVNPKSEDDPGVYIYDISSDQKKLLIPDARFVICSPVDLRISYVKGPSIWIMDLKDSTEKILYKGEPKEYISNMHWTPDGKFIYMICYWKAREEFREKLIEVSTNKEVPFKKIGHGFNSYTWK